MADRDPFNPDWATSPAESIRRALIRRGWSPEDLAEAMEVSVQQASELHQGIAAIDKPIAAKLTAALNTSEGFWLERQRQYQTDQKRISEAADGAAWLRELPLRDMIKFGWLKPGVGESQKVTAALAFFGVSSIADWKSKYRRDLATAAFRTSLTFTSNPVATASWLRWAKLQAQQIATQPFDAATFKTALVKLRALTRRKDPEQFVPELRRICAACGVALIIARAPEGCRASGATRFLTPTKAMIVMSFRYRSDDHFWFTFFHEAAHLLLHGKKALFLEDGSEVTSEEENEANDLASAILLPPAAKAELERLPLSAKAIMRFALQTGVSAGVVVGQLQHSGRLAHNRLNSLKRRWAWSGAAAALPTK